MGMLVDWSCTATQNYQDMVFLSEALDGAYHHVPSCSATKANWTGAPHANILNPTQVQRAGMLVSCLEWHGEQQFFGKYLTPEQLWQISGPWFNFTALFFLGHHFWWGFGAPSEVLMGLVATSSGLSKVCYVIGLGQCTWSLLQQLC